MMRSLLIRPAVATVACGLSLLLAIPFPALAADAVKLPQGMEQVTSVEGITEYRLQNGLGVLLFPDSTKPTVTVNITYKVGSRHEGYGEKGMAHLLEHLLFKGTPTRPSISQELTERGARANGTTWYDRTNYYETVHSTEDNLRWALELEADRMINANVAKSDLVSEFSVVRNEFERGENSPGSVLHKRMLPTMFQWHNYGRATIGEKSDIEGAPIERLQAFYRMYYQPDNAVLIVAGRFDVQKTLNQIHEIFGKIPKPTRTLISTYTEEPVQDGEREVTLRRSGDVQLFSAMFRGPAGSHPDNAALSVLTTLLVDEPMGRLYKALVDTKKAASVSASTSGFAEAGYVTFSADARMEQPLEEVRKTLLAELDGLRTNPPTQEEVDRAKIRRLKNFDMLLKQSDRLGLTLSEYIAMGDWRMAFMQRDMMEKVTAADVARVAEYYFKPANRTLGSFIPDAKPDRTDVPRPPDLTALLKDYKGRPPLSEGENFEATPENIEKRTTRTALANGMKVALLPKETRGDVVTASISLRFGTLESLRGKAIVGGLAGSLIDRGTKTMTRQQIKDRLDKLKARLSIGGGATEVSAFIETDRANLPEVIRLAGEILREPSFPEEEFLNLRQEYLARLEEQKSEPNAIGGNRFARISSPPYPADDLRYTMTFDEEAAGLKAVKLEDIREFHRSFYGASNGTAAVTGDFDAKEVEAVLAQTFGNWKSPQPYKRIETPYVDVAPKTETILTPDKANAVFIAGYGFPLRDDDPDYPAITIGGHILGGGFLNSRLATRIRQKDGLSYGVRGGFSASALDKNASFSASMIYNPINLEKLELAFREEMERAAKDGFTPEELEAAKVGWLKSRKVGRSGDAELAGILNRYLFLERDLHWDARQEAAVEALTLEQVNAAMKKYLDYSRTISVKAGDFKKS